MERRTFLRWAVHGLGAVFGAVLGFPAVVYLIDPRNRPARERGLHPVARVRELTANVPREVVIRETRQDAWTLHPNEVVGRVWVVLRQGTNAAGEPNVDVFTTTCPHLGCSINYTGGEEFLCPCHGARYELNGQAIRQDKSGRPVGNPAPRHMDSLEKELRPVPGVPGDYDILVKYEKFKAMTERKEPVA
jgi:Rieske Fe-S protein